MAVIMSKQLKVPTLGIPVSDLEVGSSVFIPINGVPVEHIIVHHGNPNEAVYDASCDGTWLWSRELIASTGQLTIYSYDAWPVQDEFETRYNNVDASIRQHIKTIKIPYVKYDTEIDSDGSYSRHNAKRNILSDGLSCNFFILNPDEATANMSPNECTLDYFSDVIPKNSGGANASKLIAYYNGEAKDHYFRPAYITDTSLGSDGGLYMFDTDWSNGVLAGSYGSSVGKHCAPACIVPKETLVDPKTFELLGVA